MMTCVSLGLGVLQRSAPQWNLFSIGLPVRILVHLVLIAGMLPGLSTDVAGGFARMIGEAGRMLEGG